MLSPNPVEQPEPVSLSEEKAMTPILGLSGITKAFANKQVLKGIDLSIAPGQLVALVGNNGQGKTTLMKLILGLLSRDGGEILLDGEPVSTNRTPQQKALLGYLPETVAFYPNLSGLETLRYLCALKQDAKARVDEVLTIVGLEHAARYRVKTYSKGMRQRLGLAQALLGRPKLLLLDEPTNGLDPSGIHEFYQILERLKGEGVAILMSSHLLAEIEPRSDSLALLKEGAIEAYGSVDKLIGSVQLPSVIRFRRGSAFSQERLQNILETHNIEAEYIERSESFSLTCGTADKQSLLHALLSPEGLIAELVVNDPGLEELFLYLNRDLEIK